MLFSYIALFPHIEALMDLILEKFNIVIIFQLQWRDLRCWIDRGPRFVRRVWRHWRVAREFEARFHCSWQDYNLWYLTSTVIFNTSFRAVVLLGCFHLVRVPRFVKVGTNKVSLDGSMWFPVIINRYFINVNKMWTSSPCSPEPNTVCESGRSSLSGNLCIANVSFLVGFDFKKCLLVKRR